MAVPLVAHTGRARFGARVRPGWFAQTHEHPELAGGTLLEILHRGDAHRSGIRDEDARRVLGRYELGFPGAVQLKRDKVRSELKELQKHYKWPGGDIPSGAWIAEKAGQKDLYDYLHACNEPLAALLCQRDHAPRLGASLGQGDHGQA